MSTRVSDAADTPGHWRVERSRIVHADRWITLRADDCRTPDGHAVAPFYVLDYPDWVAIVAIDGEGHVILAEQYRHAITAMSLELPAGAIDADDASPIAAARRELREETGYAGGEATLVARIANNAANHTNHCHVVLIRGVRPERAPADDPTERIRVRPTPIAEAIAATLSGGIVQGVHIAALALALTSAELWEAPAPER